MVFLKKIIAILIFMFIAVLITGFWRFQTADAALNNFAIMAENRYLALYFNQQTAEVIIRDKNSDNLWFSNPPNWQDEEKIARGSLKERLGSQLRIFYSVEGAENTRNSYVDSVLLDQFEFEQLDQGLKIHYLMGDEWASTAYMPVILDENDLYYMLEYIEDESDREFVKNSYVRIGLRRLQENERIQIFDLNMEKTFGEYTLYQPGIEMNEREKKQFKEHFVTVFRNHRQDILNRADINKNQISYLKQSNYFIIDDISRFDRQDIMDILQSTNYSPRIVQSIHLKVNLDPPSPRLNIFSVSLEYRLEKDELVVEVPLDEIVFPKDVIDIRGAFGLAGEQVSFPLHKIEVLPFFGAADRKENGYIFVPDGTGALIELNQKRSPRGQFSTFVYGDDNSLEQQQQKTRLIEQSFLPIYGIKSEEKAWLAIMEGSDVVANIRAEIAGGYFSYNYVFPRFNILPFQEVERTYHAESDAVEALESALGVGSPFRDVGQEYLYPDRFINDNIKIRYLFINNKEEANYVGMANKYRNYLTQKYDFGFNKNTDINYPFYLELIGGVSYRGNFLGIPREEVLPLTGFNKAVEVLEEFKEKEINNIVLKYSGWTRGGINHEYPQKIRLEKSLGSREEYNNLLHYIEKSKIDFYPDIDFQYLWDNNFLDGFVPRRDSVRNLSRQIGKYSYKFNPVNFRKEPGKENYIISPGLITGLVKSFSEDLEAYNIKSLSLRNIGGHLNSDYRWDNYYDRQEAQMIINDNLSFLKNQKDLKIMTGAANSFVLQYVDHVIDLPHHSSDYFMISQNVPFYEMVIRGLVNYTYQPLNFYEDQEYLLLKSLETGAGLYFRFFYEGPAIVKGTEFNHLYSAYYKNWFNEAISMYKEAKKVIGPLESQRIINHKKLKDGVFKTVFQDGDYIIVNYNQRVIKVNDIQIEDRSYYVGRYNK